MKAKITIQKTFVWFPLVSFCLIVAMFIFKIEFIADMFKDFYLGTIMFFAHLIVSIAAGVSNAFWKEKWYGIVGLLANFFLSGIWIFLQFLDEFARGI